jgi:hypothetical protein
MAAMLRRALVFALFSLSLSGCGGGGSSAIATTAARLLGAGAPAAGRYLEFLNASDQAVDPFDLRTGDLVRLAIVNYDPMGNRTELNSYSWSVTGSGAALESGRFLRVMAAASAPFTITGLADFLGSSITRTAQGRARAAGGPITGQVRDILTNLGVKHVQVDFFAASGAWVGSSVTDASGGYSATVSAAAARMSLNPNTINSDRFYKTFRFNSLYYIPADSNCHAAVSGTALSAILLLPISFGPPPAPDGCSA